VPFFGQPEKGEACAICNTCVCLPKFADRLKSEKSTDVRILLPEILLFGKKKEKYFLK
jgi:hypothetical protein